MGSLTRRRMICSAIGLSAPLLLAASARGWARSTVEDEDAGLLTGQSDEAKKKRCKSGYEWDDIRQRCVPDGDALPCFVTTACCSAVGLPDDCFELAELRRFREAVMRPTDLGRRVIDEYAVVGPEILKNIPDEVRHLVLCNFYVVYVLPCVLLARLGSRRTVMKIYAYGAARILKKYAPEVYAARASHWARIPA